jgi:hypothetical protein
LDRHVDDHAHSREGRPSDAPQDHDVALRDLNLNERDKVARIEEKELQAHRDQIGADVKKLVEKYRAIFDWDVPDIDQGVADKVIVTELRKALVRWA